MANETMKTITIGEFLFEIVDAYARAQLALKIGNSELSTALSAHNTDTEAHSDIHLLIQGLTNRLNALADSDDTTLDQLSEIVAYIKSNKSLIESVTTSKVNYSDIINNLTTNSADKVLSAAQGVELKRLIDAIKVITKLSEMQDDSSHRTVTDEQIETWNGKSDFSGNYNDLENQPTIPAVPTKLSAFENDAGYAKKTELPTKTSQLANDSGFAAKTDIPTVVQEAGESETLVMSQKAVADFVNDALGKAESYETVDSVDDMIDTSKSYVLSSTGTIWVYRTETTTTTVPNFTNLIKFGSDGNPTNVTLNQRLNSSGTTSAQDGSFVINDYIPANGVDNTICINRKPVGQSKATHYTNVSGTTGGAGNASIVTTAWTQESDYYVASMFASTLSSGNYFKFSSQILTTTLTSDDLKGVIVTYAEPITYTEKEVTVSEWYDTGMTPSTGGGGGNYVTLLVDVQKNASNIAELDKRVIALEIDADTLTVPSFWQDAVDACIAKIKALRVGRNCITFPFFSDNHQRIGYAGLLIAHIMKECNIPYCMYGGDSISSGTIVDEAEMIEQDKAFDTIMSYVPNGRLCRAVGNHDGYWYDGTNKFYYTREQVYELFLREESVAQNKHFGDDGTYYYIDDIASKVRFVVLNTNGGSVDATQLAWMQNTALSFNESGWAVVFISHQPISNHYHAGISNAAAVRTVVQNYINGSSANKAAVVGWYSGHIHRDRIYTGIATNTTDDTEGTAMGFTQVTITSDHTGIAYDDATKHTVANDDKSHAIDFVTINKSTRTVNLTRLGIGNDRSYTY